MAKRKREEQVEGSDMGDDSPSELIRLPPKHVWDDSDNHLIGLPTIGASMHVWDDSDNHLIGLPAIGATMHVWDDSDNHLIGLPAIGATMHVWDDSDNHLIGLPAIGATRHVWDDSPPRKRDKSIGCSVNDGEPEENDCNEIDVGYMAEIFEQQGNMAMISMSYHAAISFYSVAIAFCGDNASYYCDRAAAYARTCQYGKAILDCQKSIAIDRNHIMAYNCLTFIYFLQGIDALEKVNQMALDLDPTNEHVRENIRAAEHKVWQKVEESGQNSHGVMSVRDQVPPPLFGNNSGAWLRISAMDPEHTNPGELYAAIIRAANQLVGCFAP